jgi:hypothetical protein
LEQTKRIDGFYRIRMKIERNRLHYAMMTGLVIVAGCASRSELSASWPQFIQTYGGDTLWALMIYLGLGFIFPRLRIAAVASIVLVFAFGVEFGQLYRAPWIEAFRETFVGAVSIGSGFLWSDFVCYTVGCGVGVLAEVLGWRRTGQIQDGGAQGTARPTSEA